MTGASLEQDVLGLLDESGGRRFEELLRIEVHLKAEGSPDRPRDRGSRHDLLRLGPVERADRLSWGGGCAHRSALCLGVHSRGSREERLAPRPAGIPPSTSSRPSPMKRSTGRRPAPKPITVYGTGAIPGYAESCHAIPLVQSRMRWPAMVRPVRDQRDVSRQTCNRSALSEKWAILLQEPQWSTDQGGLAS
jgi:hypothetical protein